MIRRNFSIKLLNDDNKFIPIKGDPTDAGFDLKARCICQVNSDLRIITEYMDIMDCGYILGRGQRVLIKTGVFIALEPGWEAQVRARSGLSLKSGLLVVNGPGTVDAGYRNEIGVIIQNIDEICNFVIKKYDRIAQMVIKEVPDITLNVVSSEEFDKNITKRNLSGFSSTGV